jgi:hypothetical protein
MESITAQSTRAGSYVAADLVREGKDFEPAMPSQRVSATQTGALFQPDWPKAENPPVSGLAFAIYRFVIPDYNGEPVLHYDWTTDPQIPGNMYYGLANFGQDKWDWYAGIADDKAVLPSLDPYQFLDNILVCVLKIGTGENELESLRIGSMAPLPVIIPSNSFAMSPITIDFDASGSTDPDGAIEEFRWDPQGDGVFEVSTGTDPHFSFTYESGNGEILPAVQAIDSGGIHNEAQASIEIHDEVKFSFGSGSVSSEDCKAILQADDGDLLLYGTSFAGSDPFIFSARLGIDSTADYMRGWGTSESEMLEDAAMMAGGVVYTCGLHRPASSQIHGLLQSWSQDGTLLWSKAFGHVDYRVEFNAIIAVGAELYVCG